MKLTLEEGQEFPILPDDAIVPARIVEIESRDPNEFRSWPDMQWKFTVLDVPSQEFSSLIGSHLWGQTTQRFTLHPDNKLRQWLEAALGVDLTEPGVEVETDAAVNREVRVLIGSYDGKKGKRNKVVGVLPKAPGASYPGVAAANDPWAAPVSTPVSTPVTVPSYDEEPPF
jgi:hypothetical protein